MRAILLLTIIAVLTIFKSFAQLPPADIQNDITLSLNFQKEFHNVPGWMVRVEKVGQWQQTWVNGVANSESNTSLNGSEKFRIGNISQTFMAVAVLKMVQNNSLQLSDPITMWLPVATTSLIPNASTITIKNLLQHTSGIAGYNEPMLVNGEPAAAAIIEDWYNSNFINNYSFDQIMNTYFTAYQPVALPTTNVFNLSDTNYLLLGEIIKNCTSLTWQQYIQQNILTPLSLTNTSCILDNALLNPPNMISGYINVEDSDGSTLNVNATVQNNSIYKAARGMISTLADLNTFWKSVRTGQIIPQNLATLLQTCDAFVADEPDGFGFGLGCYDLNQEFNWLGSDGYVEGYCSSMFYLPSIDAYVSVANNKFVVSNMVLMAEIEYIINEYYLSTSSFKSPTFSIYPNPTSDYITLKAQNTIDKIQIFDFLGRKIIEQNNINALEKTVNVSGLKDGSYVMKVEIEGNFTTQKFIKK